MLRMSVMVSVAVSQVGITELIFVNPGVKVKGQYYCDVLLSQQMLPAIKRVAERCLFALLVQCCVSASVCRRRPSSVVVRGGSLEFRVLKMGVFDVSCLFS